VFVEFKYADVLRGGFKCFQPATANTRREQFSAIS
jgi:hypothetical protein